MRFHITDEYEDLGDKLDSYKQVLMKNEIQANIIISNGLFSMTILEYIFILRRDLFIEENEIYDRIKTLYIGK